VRFHRWAAVALGVVIASSVARADDQPGLPPPPHVYVMTMGPGDHPFFRFGHNAIAVQPEGAPGVVYNWGTFDFESPTLILDFLKGRLIYWLSTSSVGASIYPYQATDRTVQLQELDLTADEARALDRRLRDNAEPEHSRYLYDYFWDNCSTRVRDAIDGAVGGQLKAASSRRPARMSPRHQALRLTADLVWEYVGLHFGLGRPTDEIKSRWEESFIPGVLQEELRQLRVRREGGERPLVKGERTVYQAHRPPPLEEAPRRLGYFAAVGLLLGALLVALRRRRIALGVTMIVLGLLAGLLGCALLFLWIFTNHRAAWANANLLQCPPWALALIAVGIAVLRRRAGRWTFWVAASVAGASLLGLLAKVLPGVSQDNVAFILVFLPLWAALAWTVRPEPA
jgi:hypothetical protein